MAANGLTPYMASNPYLANVLSAFPSGAAAYSQDLPTILKNFSGQAVPIVSYPLWNPLGDFLNGGTTQTGFQGLGFPAQFGGATVSGAGTNAAGGATLNNGGQQTAVANTAGTGTGTTNGLSTLLSMLGLTGGATTGGTAAGTTNTATTRATGTNSLATGTTNTAGATQIANALLSLLQGGNTALSGDVSAAPARTNTRNNTNGFNTTRVSGTQANFFA